MYVLWLLWSLTYHYGIVSLWYYLVLYMHCLRNFSLCTSSVWLTINCCSIIRNALYFWSVKSVCILVYMYSSCVFQLLLFFTYNLECIHYTATGSSKEMQFISVQMYVCFVIILYIYYIYVCSSIVECL